MDDAGPWGYLYFIRPLVSHSLPLLPPLTTPEVARGKKGGLGNNLFRYLRKRKRVTPISDGIRNSTLHTLDETKIFKKITVLLEYVRSCMFYYKIYNNYLYIELHSLSYYSQLSYITS